VTQGRNYRQFRLTAYVFLALGAWVFLIQPVFLGALAETFQLTARQSGYLAAIEMAGAAVTSLLAPLWINRVNWRFLAAFGLCAATLGNLLSVYLPDFGILLAARVGTSICGSGVIYALGIAMLGKTDNPDRYFGIAITLQVVLSAFAPGVLQRFIALGGAALMLALLGGLYLIALPILRWVPVASSKQAAAGIATKRLRSGLNTGIVLTLLSFLFLQAGSGAYWAFIERIGNSAQLPAIAIGNYLGIATLVAALGAVTSALLGVRLGRLVPVTAGFVVYAAGLVIINLPITGVTFLVSASLCNYGWNLILPYQLAPSRTSMTQVDSGSGASNAGGRHCCGSGAGRPAHCG
jgi:predicted MFS family arabinose efflux permease